MYSDTFILSNVLTLVQHVRRGSVSQERSPCTALTTAIEELKF